MMGGEPERPLPIAGIRVLDFSVLLPGPACTSRLAWLGAEVIKVEPPGGDPARELYGGALWELFNRGKRSVVLELKDASQRRHLPRLAETADVVVESFRPGVAERLGFGYEQMRAAREDILHCSITGFGSEGPQAMRPAHDLIFMAESGALGAPGSWHSRHATPTRPLVPLGDLAAADAAVQAILAALLRRARDGGGERLEISALDATLQAVATRAGPVLRGNALPDLPPYLDPANDLYRAGDGRYVAVAAVEPHYWRSACAVLGLERLLGAGAETWSWAERHERGERVSEAIAAACGALRANEIVSTLSAAGVPVALVRTLDEAFGEPGARGLSLLSQGWLRPPLPFEGEVAAHAPELGEANEALLGVRPDAAAGPP
jgi:crotonobetainyl-CoA:carnitine CoA-transferase CaiB-like acyl-CoA transferase